MALRATTPEPSALHTPSTPKHAGDYEPYSPRRKSARVSQRARPAQTPPHLSQAKSHTSSTGIISSPPSSPQTASKKRTARPSPTMEGRRVSGALSYDTTASAAAALGLPPPQDKGSSGSHLATGVAANGMLPTPAKTPKKRPSEKNPAISAIARNLFTRAASDDELMPSPRKKGGKKYTGLSLDSFEAEDTSSIQIYTDSHERHPSIDASANNPFYGESVTPRPEPTKRSSKRTTINIPGEGEQTLEEAEKRTDGMVYVFRGKKLFRKFADEDGSTPAADTDMNVELEQAGIEGGALRRSTMKPRLLFPPTDRGKAKRVRSQATEDEEEAVTDIEDPETPVEMSEGQLKTPKAPRFAPASPPTTTRTTRSKKVDLSSSPAGMTSDDDMATSSPLKVRRAKSESLSPFDSWQRTKSSAPTTKKRDGEPISAGRGRKKARG